MSARHQRSGSCERNFERHVKAQVFRQADPKLLTQWWGRTVTPAPSTIRLRVWREVELYCHTDQMLPDYQNEINLR
jgi:hypothetical protein